MSIIVNKTEGKVYENPEDGLYQAVVADIVDVGEVETKFGKKRKVQFTYVLGENDSEGRPFRVFQRLNASLHEKAGLYKVVRRLLGKSPEVPFDLEVLLGKQCQLDIQCNESDGRTFANVVSVLAPQKGQSVKIPSDFVRNINKDKNSNSTPKAAVPNASSSSEGVNVSQQETVSL